MAIQQANVSLSTSTKFSTWMFTINQMQKKSVYFTLWISLSVSLITLATNIRKTAQFRSRSARPCRQNATQKKTSPCSLLTLFPFKLDEIPNYKWKLGGYPFSLLSLPSRMFSLSMSLFKCPARDSAAGVTPGTCQSPLISCPGAGPAARAQGREGAGCSLSQDSKTPKSPQKKNNKRIFYR